MPDSDIAVIGAGITGLTTAYKLKKSGVSADLFEAGSEPGGAIKTVKYGEWQIEYGPNTLLLKDKEVAEFIEELGLEGEKIRANKQANKRYIVKDSTLEPLPMSALQALQTPIFSLKGKLRVLGEPFVPKSMNQNQNVADFVRRRLGEEVLDYAINPFVAGIFANNPENLSTRHAFPAMHEMEQEYGSLIWAAFAGSKKRKNRGRIPRELISFRDGLQKLPETIASSMKIARYNHRIQNIIQKKNGWFLLIDGVEFGPYKNVIVTVPLYKWVKEFLPVSKEELEILKEVTYPPLSVMHLGYKKNDVSHPLDGFGFLVPGKENRKILGALFNSSLFEGRAPKGHHLLTVFIGGGRQPKLATLKSEEMLKLAEAELRDIIGLKGGAQFNEHIYWPNSIPAYHVGYDNILQTIKQIEERNKGLCLAGNFRSGISVPDCIKNGINLAKKLLNKL